MMNKKILLFVGMFFFLMVSAIAVSDLTTWQGRYSLGDVFQQGNYTFNFTVYDASSGGNECFSNESNLSTDAFGHWSIDMPGVWTACNQSIDYWNEIKINGVSQGRFLLSYATRYELHDNNGFCDADGNCQFNSSKNGDSQAWLINNYIDLSGLGLGHMAELQCHSSDGALDGFCALQKPFILTSSSDPCFYAIDIANIGSGIKSFCVNSTGAWDFTGDLVVGGNLILGGSLTAGLVVPRANNITFIGQNGYDSFIKNDWTGGNYDVHYYDNTGTSYFGISGGGTFVLPGRIETVGNSNAYIDLDNGANGASWGIYGSGGETTGLTISYGGSQINPTGTMLEISNMASPGELLNLSGYGNLRIKGNITGENIFNFLDGGGILNSGLRTSAATYDDTTNSYLTYQTDLATYSITYLGYNSTYGYLGGDGLGNYGLWWDATIPGEVASGSASDFTVGRNLVVTTNLSVGGFTTLSVVNTGNLRVSGAINVTQQIRTGTGTAATPSHSFLARTGFGMYSQIVNTLQFAVNGTQRMNLTNSSTKTLQVNGEVYPTSLTLATNVQEDLRFPVTVLARPSTNSPSEVSYKGGEVLGFTDEAVNEKIIYFNAQLPHTYVEGTNLTPHIHWLLEDNTNCNVVWNMTYSWANMSGTFPTQSNLYKVIGSPAAADTHTYSELGQIDGTGKETSSEIIGSIRRQSTDSADTCTGKTAYLVEIDYHYYLNKLGQ